MDSPIEKITDPSFTSSAKGLMTLFGIGLIHVVIGINLKETQITIPWFPIIEFEHAHRLVYLYWALVFYAIYRYSLHHKPMFGQYYFEALSQVLVRGKQGEKFVRKAIYSGNDYYEVEVGKAKDGTNTIEISQYSIDSQNDQFYLSSNLTFNYSKDYSFNKVTCSEDSGLSIDNFVVNNEHLKARWGLEWYTDDVGQPFHETTKIKDWRLRFSLKFVALKHYLKLLIVNKDIFDTTVPIALNVFLFIYWLGRSIYQHYSTMA